ncbi:MAG: glycosyltransferase family 4 protein [Promethearchaeota archaeon]
MRICIVLPYNVIENFHGNAVRVMNMIKCLSSSHDLTILMYDQFNKRRTFVSPKITSHFISVDPWILAAAFFSRYMFRASTFDLFCTYFSPSYKFKSTLDKILEENDIDILQCENAWTIPQSVASARKNDISVIATLHDVLSERVPQLCQSLNTPKFIEKKLVSKTRDFELNAVNLTDLNACVSEEDIKTFISIGVNPKKLVIIPNGVDTKLFRPTEKNYNLINKLNLNDANPIILFSGSDMYQNRIAVNDIISKLLPNLIRKNKYAKILIVGTVGKYVNKLLKSNQSISKYLISVGYVKEILPYYSIADIVILPLNFGTGTKLKTLEAMAAGKAIISTKLGVKGIKLKNENTLIIEDSIEDYSEHIIKITKDYELRGKLEKNARNTACNYDWKKVFKAYNDIYARFAGR